MLKRVYKIRNESKVKVIVYLKRRGWKYQWIADSLEEEYGVKTTRQTVRYLYLKHCRKFPKGELDTYTPPNKLW